MVGEDQVPGVWINECCENGWLVWLVQWGLTAVEGRGVGQGELRGHTARCVDIIVSVELLVILLGNVRYIACTGVSRRCQAGSEWAGDSKVH